MRAARVLPGCDGLALGTREELEETAKSLCAPALAELDLPSAREVRPVDVYGNQARVVLNTDTLFLSSFPDGWKVVAAGCQAPPLPERPYRCDLKGGCHRAAAVHAVPSAGVRRPCLRHRGRGDALVSAVRRFVRENGPTLAFGTGFLLSLTGQAVAGHADFNNLLIAQSLHPVTFWGYLRTSDFAVDVTENWQSEFLQFFLYVFGTVWLLQRGSVLARPVGHRRGAPARPAGAGQLGGVPEFRRVRLPAPARFAGVQARRLVPRGHGRRGLTRPRS